VWRLSGADCLDSELMLWDHESHFRDQTQRSEREASGIVFGFSPGANRILGGFTGEIAK
jgi:hypothetical protein